MMMPRYKSLCFSHPLFIDGRLSSLIFIQCTLAASVGLSVQPPEDQHCTCKVFFSPLAAVSLRALMDVLLKITLLCSGERDFIFFFIMAEQSLIKNIVLFGHRSLGKPVFLAVIHSRTLKIWMLRLILLLGEGWSFIFLLQGNILEFERNYSNFTSHILERITAFLSGDKPVRE